jgi:acetamidase/formamidase
MRRAAGLKISQVVDAPNVIVSAYMPPGMYSSKNHFSHAPEA